jgi:signal transduction histidine kinase
MRRLTIRARLTAIYGALFLLAGAGLLAVTYLLMDATLDKQSPNGDVVMASAVKDGVLSPAAAGAVARKQTFVGSGNPALIVRMQGLNPQQRAVVQQKMAFAEEIQADAQAAALRSMLTRGAVALGGFAVAGIWVGWVVAGRTLRPIQQITATARRVADRNLHERIGLTGPRDELRELGDTFDDMLGRLDAAFDGQRRFVANASHELRTPLAINRTLLEVAMSRPDAPPQLRQLGDTLLEVNARHEQLISGLLTLARSEQAPAERTPVDLSDVAAAVSDQFTAAADAADVTIAVDRGAAPTVGDPVLLERLTQNLVENAVRYNARGGWVALRTATAGDDVSITVANTGPVVSPYETAGLFEPFRRLTDRVGSARGTGLGLSIVRSVARAHGGDARIRPRDGGGLVVEVTLPAARHAPKALSVPTA